MRETLQFFTNPYCREISARVTGIDNRGVLLDRTIFFPETIGLPPDQGCLSHRGHEYQVTTSIWADAERSQVVHVLANSDGKLKIGDVVTASIDWERRYLRMRAHTALHLVGYVLPYPIVGGVLYDGYGHKEFSVVKSGMGRHEVQRFVAFLVARALPVRETWDTRHALERRRHLQVIGLADSRRGDLVRAIEIGNLEPQACDGLHVKNTAEVGNISKGPEAFAGVFGCASRGHEFPTPPRYAPNDWWST